MTPYVWVLLLAAAAPSVAEYQDEPVIPESPCNLVDCVPGRRCIVVGGQAQCVPDYSGGPNLGPSPSCDTVRCTATTTCVVRQKDPQCVDVCPLEAVCVPQESVGPNWVAQKPDPDCSQIRCAPPSTCEIHPKDPGCADECPVEAVCMQNGQRVATNILQATQPPQGRCGANEVYTTCGTACEPSCRVPRPGICTEQCVVGCQCRSGFYRNDRNACVPLSSCPGNGGNGGNGGQNQCQANEVFLECGTACEPTCTDRNPICNRICVTDVCQCRSGYVRDANRRCIPVASCPSGQNQCQANEEFRECGTACEPTCTDRNPICNRICVTDVCQCRGGYVRDANRRCIPVSSCPSVSANILQTSQTSANTLQTAQPPQGRCAANEAYTTCGTACEPSCRVPRPGICTEQCVVGCQCRSGFYRNDQNACVPLSSCPGNGGNGGQNQCQANEIFLECGTVCEPSCADRSPCLAANLERVIPCREQNCPAGTVCELGREICPFVPPCFVIPTQCIPRPVTCATLLCPPGTRCEQEVINCLLPPCPQPSATCVPQSPLTCATVNCITGTTCRQINGRPQCVPINPPPTTGSPLTCATVNCITGTTCRQINGRPQCVPINPSPTTGSPLTCATVNCITGTTCQQVNGRPQCVPFTGSCPLCVVGTTCQVINNRPQCVPNPPSSTGNPLTCANVRCSAGTTCQLINNRPQCVPNPPSSTGNPLTCANVRCSAGTTCQLINNRPQCVPNPPSSTGNPLTCATVRCRDGFTCQQLPSGPQCVPNPPTSTGSPLTCATVRCRDGFNCQQINNRPQCVPNTPTSTGSSLTCDNVRCRDGTTCQQINGRPQCVPNPPGPQTCLTVPCPPGQTCQQIAVPCVPGFPCPPPTPTCVPTRPQACPIVPCPPGQTCEQIIVDCIRGVPCPQPPPRCVPAQPSITCANVRCIGGTTCQLINNRPQCVPNTPTPRIAAIETTSEEYNPCAATSCPVGQECRVRQVQCVRAPCNPIGECYAPPRDNRCPQFESFRECASYCEPTCSNKNPVCIQSCAPAKCQCNQGFYRDASGQCVTENDCDSAGAMPYRRIRL